MQLEGVTCFSYSEEVDKVYFRKKDNLSEYAEALFKTKVVLSKK